MIHRLPSNSFNEHARSESSHSAPIVSKIEQTGPATDEAKDRAILAALHRRIVGSSDPDEPVGELSQEQMAAELSEACSHPENAPKVVAALKGLPDWAKRRFSAKLDEIKPVNHEPHFVYRALGSLANATASFTNDGLGPSTPYPKDTEWNDIATCWIGVLTGPATVINSIGLSCELMNGFGRHAELEELKSNKAVAQLKVIQADQTGKDSGEAQKALENLQLKEAQLDYGVQRVEAIGMSTGSGIAPSVGLGMTSVGGFLKNAVGVKRAAMHEDWMGAVDHFMGEAAKVKDLTQPDAIQAHITNQLELMDAVDKEIVTSTSADAAVATNCEVAGQAFGLYNSLCHVVRGLPEYFRHARRAKALKVAEDAWARAIGKIKEEAGGLKDLARRMGAYVAARLKPLKSHAKWGKVNGVARTGYGGVGIGVKAASMALKIAGTKVLALSGVGSVLAAGWLTLQGTRLYKTRRLTQEIVKQKNKGVSEIREAKNSQGKVLSPLARDARDLVNACRADASREEALSFLKAAGYAQEVIKACGDRNVDLHAAMELLVTGLEHTLLAAQPGCTRKDVNKLKQKNDPRERLLGYCLERGGDFKEEAEPLLRLERDVKPSDDTSLSAGKLQELVKAFQNGQQMPPLDAYHGHNAELLKAWLDGGGRNDAVKDMVQAASLYDTLSKNPPEKVLAAREGKYPGMRGEAKYGTKFVAEITEKFMRSKWDLAGGSNQSDDREAEAQRLRGKHLNTIVDFLAKAKKLKTSTNLWEKFKFLRSWKATPPESGDRGAS